MMIALYVALAIVAVAFMFCLSTVIFGPWKPGTRPFTRYRPPPFIKPYEGWAPFCLRCDNKDRLEPRTFGWKCGVCGNEVNHDLTDREHSILPWRRKRQPPALPPTDSDPHSGVG